MADNPVGQAGWANAANRRQQLVDYIRAYTKKYGYGPTIPEIAKYFDVALATVDADLDALEADGTIRRRRQASRGRDVGLHRTTHLPSQEAAS